MLTTWLLISLNNGNNGVPLELFSSGGVVVFILYMFA